MTARAWKDIRSRILDDPARRVRVDERLREMAAAVVPVPPAELRQTFGVSQAAMATRLGISQPAVSQIERQSDPQVSTLRRYLEALGAELELRAIFPEGPIAIGVGVPGCVAMVRGLMEKGDPFDVAVDRTAAAMGMKRADLVERCEGLKVATG